MRTLRIHRLNSFLTYHAAVLAMVTVLYITSLVLVYRITENCACWPGADKFWSQVLEDTETYIQANIKIRCKLFAEQQGM